MRARLAAALGALLVTGCDNAQKADEPSLPPPRIISGPISVASACTGPSPSARPAEPSLAAAPGDPRELVATWLENPAGTVVAVSHDGGGTWSRSPLPGLLTCAGGRYARPRDPRGSIGPGGVTSISGLGGRPPPPRGTGSPTAVTPPPAHGNPRETPPPPSDPPAPPPPP